ncbi:MAG: (d)CMP kinase [Wenzhouxiangella sp.]|jgi:cytidylate kinase|nr:(d)CMP kinase [Wenzhouxiangella sp.]
MIDQAPVVTVDGPSGAGKGAVSSRLAEALGWNVLDSGAVYRSVALAALEASLNLDDTPALISLCGDLPLSFETGDDGIEAFLNGRALGDALRAEAVGQASSRVAAVPEVRAALLELQRDYRRSPGLVADGRDMGTVVFPDADVKIFLDASVEERAKRRYLQLRASGKDVTLDRLMSDLEARDRRDRERAVSPTLPATDAVIVDSTDMDLREVVEHVLVIVRQGLNQVGS